MDKAMLCAFCSTRLGRVQYLAVAIACMLLSWKTKAERPTAKNGMRAWCLVFILALLAGTADASTWSNDGGTYTLDASNPSTGGVLGSWDPLPTTTVNLVDGGYIGGNFDVVSNGRLNMYGGTVQRLDIHGTGEAYMHGGSIGWEIVMGDSGTLTIQGSDFALDGAPLPIGTYQSTDFLPDGFTPNENSSYDYIGGQLTGTLINGDALDAPFHFFFSTVRPTDSMLVLVPEPSTAMMIGMGLGGVAWGRRRSALR